MEIGFFFNFNLTHLRIHNIDCIYSGGHGFIELPVPVSVTTTAALPDSVAINYQIFDNGINQNLGINEL